VGAFGPRAAPARALRAVLEATTPNTNIDTIPIGRGIFNHAGWQSRLTIQNYM